MASEATAAGADSWNPALKPEDNKEAVAITSPEGGLSDLMAADDSPEKHAFVPTAPQSDDLAVNMSHDTSADQAHDANLNLRENGPPPAEDSATHQDTVPNNNQMDEADSQNIDALQPVESDEINAVPPHPEAQPAPIQPLPTSQAPPVEAENQGRNEPTFVETPAQNNHADLVPTKMEANTDGPGFWDNETGGDVDSDADDFFNQLKTQTKPIFAPPEADSRFEEGLPLLDESAPGSPEPEAQDEKVIDTVFADDEDEADGFFSSVAKLEPKADPGPSGITRKSTTQVIESVGFDLDSPASDISAAAQFDDVLKAAASESNPKNDPSEEELAARWQAELDDSPEDDLAARWEAALDDDDLLLEDDAAQPVPEQPVPQSPALPVTNAGPPALDSPFETPQSYARPRPVPGVYAPHQPSTADLVQGVPMSGAPPTNPAISSYFPQQPLNPVTKRAESFADRSKEGYKSPYDLPEDLSRPRRPVATYKPAAPVAAANMPPPPRDSSMMPPPPVPAMSTPAVAPPAPMAAPPAAAAAPPPAPKNFYEELPLPPPKSRPSSSGRYTPRFECGDDWAIASFASEEPSLLQPPETLDPYASSLASSAPAGPSAASRYSPKPPGLQPSTKPPALSRYSPAPPGAASRNRYVSQPLSVPGQNASLPFQPRTSSPLAYHEKVSYQPEEPKQPPSLEPAVSFSPPRAPELATEQGSSYAQQQPSGQANVPSQENAAAPIDQHQIPPKNRYAPPEYINEFAKRVVPPTPYAPAAPASAVQTSPPPSDPQMAPLRRSQTQSPGQEMTSPRLSVPNIDPLQRPASVHGSGSPTKTVNPYAPAQTPLRNRAASQHLEFIAPNDGQEGDPLERWKGAPIFKFGFGGTMFTCFPKHIPRYSAGQVAPLIRPSPGEIKTSQLSAWLPPVDTIVQHPGPLKTKSKKKDLLAWLSSKIAAFENEGLPDYDQLQLDAQKRHEERILLWKVTKILVENDGVLEGSPNIQKSLRQAIFPNLPISEADGPVGNSLGMSGGFKPLDLTSQPDAVDSRWSEELRHNLLLGDREKAVWGAVDRRLWGHAMIIASTMDKSIWKQVTQEFVRREVRSTTGNAASLASLYQIFAGNIEESVDELVPPSARAGLQLVSKADGQGATRNALEGLDSWRDTLGLALNNRSSEDHQALLALGRLLASYGRTEAAHICFIFSRAVIFGGADDPQANIVLLGADHRLFPSTLLDQDAILLTEAFEFATAVLGNSPNASIPHLLAFKLLNARYLADQGRNSEAQSYCDAVAVALKATTRPSLYYHQHLFMEVDELSARLRQTTSDDGSSWISKPSMEKVSGSMWARFNSFVAGDDSDAASTGSGKAAEAADFGPFANVAGTPTVSRSPSMSDINGSYFGAGAQPIPTGGPSRYLPSNQYAPSASPEQFRGRSSMDSQRSASFGFPLGQRRSSQEPSPLVDSHIYQGGSLSGSPGIPGYQSTPPQSSYVPLAPVEEDLTTQSPDKAAPVNGLFYQPPGQDPASAGQSPYYQGPPGMPQANHSAYSAPSASNPYEPPGVGAGITPDPRNSEEPFVDEQPKKKAFMDDDDDDDLAARAAAIQKSENDRKADDAFKKAAEEDAKRAAQQPAKKGWFGGWFGGGKKEADNSGGPIKAKLGEESSFYYDQGLKKWVNKKDPGSSAPVRATPPPPRVSAPPSRAASYGSLPSVGAPPMPVGSGSRPPSSSSAAQSISSSPAFSGLGAPPPIGSLPRSVSTGGAAPTPPGSSAGPPPSRPSSSLTHASSIDDLLGAPQARKGNSVRGKKKGRYVDVMAQ
ncbi:hypothetical protein NUU61_007277 [Penicillium alfredii]|uniref:Protein transport protein sec16 n=1 Tax=Penicillium alfredii TaxID=1506179 RepID=A0A9W9F2R9_9EURO|nr:uncharacterized protein NUU61_007277 [Penicillium alfredii]KAJ5092407.1 hypothetical protein NUU61_007277 [Penicillium alfredii]